MLCLKDFIGPYYGCDAPVPLSRMYLTQLPGIQFKNIDQIANEDQVTWAGLWSDLQATAIDTFREDVIEEFGKRYQLKQITQTVDLGKLIDITALTVPAANTSNGILLELYEQGSQCIGSNLMGIYIQTVSFYWYGTNGAPTFTLTFQDADLLTIEKTITPTTVTVGWNTVWVDTNFSAQRLNILASGNFDDYVTLDISLFNLNTFSGQNWGFNNGAYLYFNWFSCGTSSRLQGLTYNTSTNTGMTGTNTFGMSVMFSNKCSWDSVVCANKRHFASAWQHLLGIELMNYRLNSSRLNRWTTINEADAKELQKTLTMKYRGGQDESKMYPGKLQNAITSLVLNDMDGCIRKNDYLIFRESRM